jgi:sulfopyruvate decarboxylase subunit alpha
MRCVLRNRHHDQRVRGEFDTAMNKRADVAKQITEEFASSGIKLVATLPDNWINPLIDTIDRDRRFTHIPVNREESAVALCSGAFMGGTGSVALMGASGFMTLIYAITKINYTYEIPVFYVITLRGAVGDPNRHHVSNGLYLRRVIDAIDMPCTIIDKPEEIPLLSRAYRHSRNFYRSTVVALTRDLLR